MRKLIGLKFSMFIVSGNNGFNIFQNRRDPCHDNRKSMSKFVALSGLTGQFKLRLVVENV